MPAYSGTNDYSQIDTTVPDGAVEPVLNLAPAVREIKRVAEAVMEKEHGSDGTHSAGAIITSYIADNAVTTAKVVDGAITSAKLASGATTPGAGTITGSQLANQTITQTQLANLSVGTAQVIANAITPAKLGGGSTAGQLLIADGSGNFAAVTMSGDATIASSGAISVNKTFTLPVIIANDLNHVTYSSAAWTTRSFTKTLDTNSLATFTGGGVFTLTIGSYLVFGTAQTFNTGLTQLRLASAPSGSPTTYTGVLYGLSSYAGLDANVGCDLFGAFTVSDATVLYQFQHYITYSGGNDDSGLVVGIADKLGEIILVKYA